MAGRKCDEKGIFFRQQIGYNKPMKFFTSLFLLVAVVAAQAQTTLAWEYNFKSRDWSPLAATKLRTLEQVPLLRTLDISGVFALQSGTVAPSMGFMASRSFTLAKGVDGVIGITVRYVQGQTPKAGGIVLGVKF